MTEQNTTSDQNVTSVPPAPPASSGAPALAGVPPAAAAARPDAGPKLNYRPVSGWAVAGILIGGCVSTLVLVSVLYYFVKREPIALPRWFVILPALVGVVISLIAMWQIADSEGTRSGAKLATAGLVLSLVTGAGFLVFNFSQDFALQSQANAFIMQKSADDDLKSVPDNGFIPRLLEGCKSDKEGKVQFNCAFLLTIPDRGGVNPGNEKAMRENYDTPGKEKLAGTFLSRFNENALVKYLKSLSPEDLQSVTVEPAGVLRCDYEPPVGKGRGSYRVIRNYLVKTPEGVRLYVFDVRSIEPSGPGERRKWVLSPPVEQEKQRESTPLGSGLQGLRISAYEYLTMLTRNGIDLSKIDKTAYEARISPKSTAEQVRKIVAESDGKLGSQLNQLLLPNTKSVDATPWKRLGGGRIGISYPVQMKIDADGRAFELKGYLNVESKGPIDPASFTPEQFQKNPPEWTSPTLEWFDVVPFELPRKEVKGKGVK